MCATAFHLSRGVEEAVDLLIASLLKFSTGVRSLVVHLSCLPNILWLSDTRLVFSMRSGSRCTVARNPAWWERTPRFAAIAPGSGPILS
jgi:hypothetical protein